MAPSAEVPDLFGRIHRVVDQHLNTPQESYELTPPGRSNFIIPTRTQLSVLDEIESRHRDESSVLDDLTDSKIPDMERRLNLVMRAIGMPLYQVVALPMTVRDMMVGVIYVLRQSAFTFILWP